MNTVALLLALCAAIGADDFQWAVTDAPAFSWSITTNGGDASLPQDAAVPGTDAPPSSGSAVEHSAISPAAEPSTAICPCLGYRGREHCFCLQRGVACRCNRTTGSEWLMDDGRPVRKTGHYADPRGASAIARSDAPAASAPANSPEKPDGSYEVTRRTDGRYWWKGSNGTWFGTATLTEGQTYVSGTNRFVYRDGKMHEGAKMAADIAPKASGHWVRRCENGVCRLYWIAE